MTRSKSWNPSQELAKDVTEPDTTPPEEKEKSDDDTKQTFADDDIQAAKATEAGLNELKDVTEPDMTPPEEKSDDDTKQTLADNDIQAAKAREAGLNELEVVLTISGQLALQGDAGPPPDEPPPYSVVASDDEIEGDAKNAEAEDKKAERKRKEKEMWDVVIQEDNRTPWSELRWWQVIFRICWVFVEVCLVLGFLYIFICSIDVLGDSFQILGGRAAGKAFSTDSLLNNAICGLMLGVMCTALLQSSSTTTSITVTLVGTGLISVQQGIPIIMGANIGTSVTSTIVAFGQAGDRSEFRRAFAGATVHDMFKGPVLTDMLYHLTKLMVDGISTGDDYYSPELLNAIIKPLTDLIIQVDKDVVTAISIDSDYQKRTLVKYYCKETVVDNEETWPLGQENETFIDTVNNDYWAFNVEVFNRTGNGTMDVEGETVLAWRDTVHNVSSKCGHLFVGQGNMPDSTLSETAVGLILLIGSMVVLLLSIVLMVRVLQDLFKGAAARAVCKLLNADFPGYLAWLTGYLAILVGCGFTILVQSSSVFTSIVTPLVGAGLITVERMFPLTLGANLGTTFTSIMAAFTNEGEGLQDALQLSFVHLMFNVFGIAIWYPVPLMRRAPIWLAKFLGNTTADYRWFPALYLLFMFLLFPLLVFALSMAGVAVMMAVLIPIIVFIFILVIVNVIQAKKPNWLPKKLRSWDWLPLWMHSLQPYDRVFTKWRCCKRCRQDEDSEEDPKEVVVTEAERGGEDLNVQMTAYHTNEGFDCAL